MHHDAGMVRALSRSTALDLELSVEGQMAMRLCQQVPICLWCSHIMLHRAVLAAEARERKIGVA